MKKFVIFLLCACSALAFSLSLTACSGDKGNQPTSNATDEDWTLNY